MRENPLPKAVREERTSDTPFRPIIFVGPSIPLDIAKRALPHADYRPPIKRGDLDDIPSGAVVGIIDGVFAQALAISPGEIRETIDSGVAIYGAASMGALRALTEVRKVIGVGRIFEMYSTGTIERDDEVALLFDPETYSSLTEPLVNVRYAVERLVRSATLSRDAGNALIEACLALHFTERTYGNIIKNSKLAHNIDAEDIIRLLRKFDLKRDDAQFLLETVALVKTSSSDVPVTSAVEPVTGGIAPETRVHDREDSDSRVLIWESGDSMDFKELVRFLKVTGTFETFARNALGRLAVANSQLHTKSPARALADPDDGVNTAQSILDATRMQWGWESPEEAHVTMRDLGLGLLDVAQSLEAEATATRLIAAFGTNDTQAFMKALRSELWMNELALKREAMRFGALQFFASFGSKIGPPTDSQISDAKRCICRLRGAMQWSLAQSELRALGVSQSELDVMVREFALARRTARPIVEALDHRSLPQGATSRAADWRSLGLGLESSLKAEGSNRFSLSLEDGGSVRAQIAKQMGVVRIGLIGELDTLGVHVAQAFGERSGWSSTFSSGKAETREGARVGSIMEEAELHAQDAFPSRTRNPNIVCRVVKDTSARKPAGARLTLRFEILRHPRDRLVRVR